MGESSPQGKTNTGDLNMELINKVLKRFGLRLVKIKSLNYLKSILTAEQISQLKGGKA